MGMASLTMYMGMISPTMMVIPLMTKDTEHTARELLVA